MTILRTIKCDVCGTSQTEENAGDGWQGWGALHGISLDGVENPSLCNECLNRTASYVDSLKNGSGK